MVKNFIIQKKKLKILFVYVSEMKKKMLKKLLKYLKYSQFTIILII